MTRGNNWTAHHHETYGRTWSHKSNTNILLAWLWIIEFRWPLDILRKKGEPKSSSFFRLLMFTYCASGIFLFSHLVDGASRQMNDDEFVTTTTIHMFWATDTWKWKYDFYSEIDESPQLNEPRAEFSDWLSSRNFSIHYFDNYYTTNMSASHIYNQSSKLKCSFANSCLVSSLEIVFIYSVRLFSQ